MPEENVIKRIHSEKVFIKKLFMSSKNKYQRKKVLNSSSEDQLNAVLELLHYVLCKEVPIKTSHLDKIVRSNRLPSLVRNLQKKEDLSAMLKQTRSYKINFISNISCLSMLLHNCFHD